jgi:hypothetical protein
MGSEYVKFSAAENNYGQSSLLGAQLDLLNCIKKIREHKKLRMQSALLKIELRAKIEETKGLLDNLNKMLPRSEYMLVNAENPKKIVRDARELSLEDEIDLIQRKLSALQGD